MAEIEDEVNHMTGMMKDRIKDGQTRYHDDWRGKDTIKEAEEELADFFNYIIMEWCKTKSRMKPKKNKTLSLLTIEGCPTQNTIHKMCDVMSNARKNNGIVVAQSKNIKLYNHINGKWVRVK